MKNLVKIADVVANPDMLKDVPVFYVKGMREEWTKLTPLAGDVVELEGTNNGRKVRAQFTHAAWILIPLPDGQTEPIPPTEQTGAPVDTGEQRYEDESFGDDQDVRNNFSE